MYFLRRQGHGSAVRGSEIMDIQLISNLSAALEEWRSAGGSSEDVAICIVNMISAAVESQHETRQELRSQSAKACEHDK